MLLGVLAAGLGLLLVAVGLWPGVVVAGLTGPGQGALFFLGLALLSWGSVRVALRVEEPGR